jgi:hypothetical protein
VRHGELLEFGVECILGSCHIEGYFGGGGGFWRGEI